MNEVEEDGEEVGPDGEEDGEEGGPKVEDEDVTEEDLSGVHVEVVESTHEGTKWLIVNGIHICNKQREVEDGPLT